MFQGKSIAVVVPAFKEELHIEKVIRGVPSFVDHIVVVDDHSPDGTYEAAQSVKDNRLVVIRHEVNQGVGGSIITAHKQALDLGSDVNVVMAGDNQMDPDFLEKLIQPVTSGGFGFAKANRFFSTNSFKGMPKYRVFGNVVLTFLTKASSGYWHLFDPQNGYTAISKEALNQLPLERISKRYDFENDLLIWLSINDVRAIDVSIPARYGDETSTISLRKTIPHLLGTLHRGFWRRMLLKYVLRSFSAIALLFFAGLCLFWIGVIIGIFAIVNSIGPQSASAGTILLAVVPAMTGVQLLIQALVLDIQNSPGS